MNFPFAFENFLLSVLVLLAAYRRSLYFFRVFPLIIVRILSFLCFFSFTASWISFKMVSKKRSCFCISEALQEFIPAFFIIFIVFLFGRNGELIFTVEKGLSCCFCFFNLTIFLCNLSSLRIFSFSGSLASFWELQRYHHRRKISVSIDCCITFVVFTDFLNQCFLSLFLSFSRNSSFTNFFLSLYIILLFFCIGHLWERYNYSLLAYTHRKMMWQLFSQ